jgi:hypothetical protein
MDFIVGNVGANSFYRPTDKYPIRVYGKDFDNNGSYDVLPSMYLPGQDGKLEEFPAQTRDDLIKQMIEMRAKFKTYRDFATATFDKLLSPEQLKGALILSANNFKSCYIRNDGTNNFTMVELPVAAQVSSVFGMLAEDVDGDGNLDVIMNGNDYGTEVAVGRYDAFNGLILKGDGKGNFKSMSILESGIFIPGNGKALVKFSNSKGQYLVAASQNRGPLKIFQLKNTDTIIPFQTSDSYAILKLKNGKTRKVETNYGAGFLSQSARLLSVNRNVSSVDIFDYKGNRRSMRRDK